MVLAPISSTTYLLDQLDDEFKSLSGGTLDADRAQAGRAARRAAEPEGGGRGQRGVGRRRQGRRPPHCKGTFKIHIISLEKTGCVIMHPWLWC